VRFSTVMARARLFMLLIAVCAAAPGREPPTTESSSTSKSVAKAAEVLPVEAGTHGITLAVIERRRAELDEATGLTPEVREQIADQYTKAVERLEAGAQAAAQLATLRAESAKAPHELERLDALAAQPLTNPDPPVPAATDTEHLRGAHRDAEAAHEDQRRRLAALTTEIERRTVRSRELPDLTAQSRAKLESIAEGLAAPPAAGEPPELTAARRLRLEVARQHRLLEVELFQQEFKTYADTSRVLALEGELAERAVQAAGRTVANLAKAVADHDRREAEARAAEARRAAINAHPTVQQAAQLNTALADEHARLVAAAEDARAELARVEALREELGGQYADTRRRAEEARFSQAVGMMLRNQQAELPDTAASLRRAADRASTQADLNFKLLDWENERRRLQHVDDAVDAHLQDVADGLQAGEQVDVRGELQQVFRGRLKLYGDLITTARTHLGRLSALQTADEGLVRVVDEQRAFISQHILWVRSTAVLSPALVSPLATALGDLADPTRWRAMGRDLVGDVRAHPFFELLVIPPIWLMVIRRRLLARLARLAHDARRSSLTGLAPTLEAVAATAGLAVPLPALIALVGWRLTEAGAAGSPTQALGLALLWGAGALAAINVARGVCLPDGLGEAHFGWEHDSTAAIRRTLSLVRTACLPASVVCMFTEFLGDDLLTSTVGRIALIVESLTLATITADLFRGSGPLRAMLARHHPGAWFQATDRLWAFLLVAMPVLLAMLSAGGYHYTATRLATRMAATWGVIALGVGLRAFAMRWLMIVYRRLAMKRARERRAELQSRQAGDSDVAQEIPVTDDRSLELRLSDINEQSQRLVRLAVIGLGCALLALIWHDIVPAVGYIERFTLWTSGLAGAGEGAEAIRITLWDLLLAATWVTVTLLACRNLPGLLDLVVFQRLPLDAGARYAATAVTQYLLVVLGAVLGFRQIGIGWQSVQWLVAAMTVGLGFGLQEIFANFVSGIILLFERPVRVGDVVTIGDVTGTVMRIRIRATTILDWDHKELIVPNRDFVTGKLINWTLTNSNLRVVVRVGIAYGSDTRLAVRLLESVAASQPLALAEPPPVVVFSQFGTSSLDFELRVFASGVVNARMLRHELHLAIDDAFRGHGVEIAFPQQDLHVRSMPEAWFDGPARVPSAAVTEPGAAPSAAPGGTSAPRRHVA